MKLNEKWTLFLIATFVTFFGIADTLLKGTKAMDDISMNGNTLDGYSIYFDDSLNVDRDNKYINYFEVGTTVDYLISKINAIGATVIVTSKEGYAKNNTNVLATGDKVNIYVDDTIKDNYVISVMGDSDGDGIVGLIDLVQMRKHLAEWKNLDTNELEMKSTIYYCALDFNKDGNVDLIDLVRMRKVVMGMDTNEKN